MGKRLQTTLVATLTAAGVFASVSLPAQAAWPGKNGRIFFYRQIGEGPDEIFSVKPDGTGRKRLTSDNKDDESPAVSADGKWIVWERELPNSELFKMRTDGSNRQRLTNTAHEEKHPSWSPTGNKIVFTSDQGGEEAIWIMNADGTGRSKLTDMDGEEYGPKWSPNGNWIAFTNDNEIVSICKIRPNGSDEVCLTDESFERVNDADWSPNSQKIVFEGREPDSVGDEDVYKMSANGSNVVQLTEAAAEDDASDPAFSPTGAKIIFETKTLPPNQLWRMNADGSNEEAVTPEQFDVQDPDWAPKP